MGAASSASVAAAVEAYSEKELEEVVGNIPSDCRVTLLNSLKALAEDKAKREAQPTMAGVPPKEEVEPLTPEEMQAPPAKEPLSQEEQCKIEEKAKGFVGGLTKCMKAAPKEEAVPKMVLKQMPGGEVHYELSQAHADYLHNQIEVLADPTTGGVRISALGALFEHLGTKITDGDLQALLDASGSQGKSPTPGQFLDFILEGVQVV